jgi:hypothetical protein
MGGSMPSQRARAELVIDRKLEKTFGIMIPQEVLLRADEATQ